MRKDKNRAVTTHHRSLPQSVWEQRALSRDLVLLEVVKRNDENVKVRCLKCDAEGVTTPARIQKGSGCATCSRKNTRISQDAWYAKAKELQFSWLAATPEALEDKSKKAVCNLCGQTWSVVPRSLYQKKDIAHPRCPKRKIPGRLSYAEWQKRAKVRGLQFLEEPRNSKSKTKTRCNHCDFTWLATPDHIWNMGSGCPRCALGRASQKRQANRGQSNNQRIAGYRAKALEMNLEFLDSEDLRLGQRCRMKCLVCGHEFAPFLANVMNKGTGCPQCAKNITLAQEEWDKRAREVSLEWLEPVQKRHKKYRARCSLCGYVGSVWASSVAQGHGCKICGAVKASLTRRLDSDIWIARALDKGLEWTELPSNNIDRRMIRCLACGHEWEVAPVSLAGCPVCAGVKVPAETWHSRALEKRLEWIDEPQGARLPKRIRCLVCGLVWNAAPSTIAHASGCPSCAEYGFNPRKPAFLYFIEDPTRGVRKVGIANESKTDSRLRQHEKNGFQLLHLKISDTSGLRIARLESEVLNWLRIDLKLPQVLSQADMPQRGWTETFPSEGPSNKIIERQIRDIYKSLAERQDS